MKPIIEGQRGASLLAVIFLIVAVAFFGAVVVSLVATQSFTSVNEMQSTQALYVAEAGLERAISYLLGPTLTSRTTCAGLPGAATSLNPGQFQLDIEAGSPFYSTIATTIPAGPGVASVDTTIPVVSTANYAPYGRIMIDRELIDYTGTTANSFTGSLRGRDGTLATSHVTGTRVGQSQCTVTSTGGVTDLTTAARGRRVERAGIQIQEAWAVGDINAGRATLLRWNGVNWTDQSAALLPAGVTQNLNAVAMLSYADGVAVGDAGGGIGACTNNAQIAGWNGLAWTCTVPSPTDRNMNAVSMLSTTSGWAAGARNGNDFTFMRWDNPPGLWTVVSVVGAANTRANLNGIFLLDTTNDGVVDDGWAVGDRGSNKFTFLRYSAGSWTYQGQADGANRQNLRAVYLLSSSDGWAVGDGGVILRYDPVLPPNWDVNAAPGAVTGNNLRSVTCAGLSSCWAVGDGGVILRWSGGAAWSVFAAPGAVTGNNLRGAACSTVNDCWAVGDAGAIVHWDGNAWSVHPQSGVVTTRNLRGINIIGPRGRPQAVWREVVS